MPSLPQSLLLFCGAQPLSGKTEMGSRMDPPKSEGSVTHLDTQGWMGSTAGRAL